MKRFATLLILVATIGVLLALMIALQGYDYTGTSNFDPKVLVATGFIILAAFTSGELSKQVGLPAMLGYIAAGVLFGPKFASMLPNAPAALFSDEIVSELSLINVLTVGLIGTMGGGELKIQDVRRNIKTILMTVGAIAVLALPTTIAVVMLLIEYVPSVVPFVSDMSSSHKWAAAMLFGVFAMATSPTVTLAIMQDSKSKGQFTSLVLGIAVVADIVLVETFLIVLAIVKLMVAPAGFDMGALMAALPGIGAEIMWALIIGVAMGGIFILYLQFVAREMLLFTVAIIFAGSYVASAMHAETLMAFLTAGFVVQNFSKHGHDMIESLENISIPVFVIYFMTQATLLDLNAVAGYLWLTLTLTTLRTIAHVVGINLASRLSGSTEAMQRYGWFSFLSLGSVDLVLAAMVANSVGEWGQDFQTVIMSCVVIHIVLGPPLLKLALDWSGESEGSRRQSSQEAAALDEVLTTASLDPEDLFPVPDCDDELNTRLELLRARLVGLYQTHVADTILERSNRLKRTVTHLRECETAAVRRLRAVLEDEQLDLDQKQAAIDAAYMDYLREIKSDIDVWESFSPLAVDLEAAQQVLSDIKGIEPFRSSYRVTRDPRLFDPLPDDPMWRRALKLGRRLRRGLVGPGLRTVSLGRMWRFFVELSVPRYLARAVTSSASANEKLWAELSENLRYMAEYHDRVGRALAENTAFIPTEEKLPPDDLDHSHDHHVSEEAHPATALECALLTHTRFEKHMHRQSDQLAERLEVWSRVSRDMYTLSFQEPWRMFLDAVNVAGTWELPAWRYRPSAVFDRALRAEQTIRERLRREATVVGGHRGWIVVEHQLVMFSHWFADYQNTVLRSAGTMILDPCQRQIEALSRRLTMQLDVASEEGNKDAPIAWEEWLNDTLRPGVRGAERSFENILASFTKGTVAKRHLGRLDAELDTLAQHVVLADVKGGQMITFDVPLRVWMEAELAREVALRFVEFNERAQALMRAGIDGLADVQQVVEFNVMTAHRDHVSQHQYEQANQLAMGGLSRAMRLVRELGDQHQMAVDELKRWFATETTAILHGSTRAFYAQDLGEIQRRLRRDDSVLATVRGSWLRPWWALKVARENISERVSPVVEDLREDIQGLLTDDTPAVSNADIRQRLLAFERTGHLHVPAIYRRLFTPVPLDIPDFYVLRPDIEQACAKAAEEWLSHSPTSVLLVGDRGMGKRSTIHHLTTSLLRESFEEQAVDVVHVVLREDQSSEEELAHELAEVLRCETVTSLAGIARYLRTRERRVVIVVENGEKMFERSEAGIDMCASFLQLISDTVDNALWFVLMGSPAATWLATAIGFMDYFTHVLEFAPLDEDGLRQMIMRRHRVSGFDTTFDRRALRPLEWVRNPLAMSDAVRDHESEFFTDLARLSGGNPLLALLYWLESVAGDPQNDQVIHVRPLPVEEMRIVGSVSLEKILVLSALVQHRSLTALQLARVLRRDLPEVRTELEHLSRLGFVEAVVGQDHQSYQLKPLAEALVTIELRAQNMV